MNSKQMLELDLGGSITEAHKFFSAWSHSRPGGVIVITYRRDRQKAIDDLYLHNFRYDDVPLVNRFDAKAVLIAEYGVTFL